MGKRNIQILVGFSLTTLRRLKRQKQRYGVSSEIDSVLSAQLFCERLLSL